MTRTLTDLYLSRCYQTPTGEPKPHFWKPQPQKRRPLCLLADEKSGLLDEKTNDAALRCMRRLISMGLALELPVGQFIEAQSRRDLPQIPYVRELLKSAVADEARHDLGFRYAADSLGVATAEEQTHIADLAAVWVTLGDAEKYQPIAVAGQLEKRVFLVTLGLMRLIGGVGLTDLAMRIAEDEARHVATNNAIGRWLGVSFGREVEQLIEDTLSFALGDLRFTVAGIPIDVDFLLDQSQQLEEYGFAQELDDLTRIAIHRMPFEVANQSLYSREADDGAAGY